MKVICHKNAVDLKIWDPSPFGDAFFFKAEAPVAAGISKVNTYAENKEFPIEASHQDEGFGFKTDQKGSQQSFEGIGSLASQTT